jgi:hypothetical protein
LAVSDQYIHVFAANKPHLRTECRTLRPDPLPNLARRPERR